jgi:hypothetical protein
MRHTTLILTVVASALTIAATTARAQAAAAMAPVVECGPGTAYPNCEDVPRPRSRLFEGIELTGTQQDSIDAITRRYRALQGRVNAQSLPVDAHNAQVLALRARDIAEKRKVMTPAQLPRFDKNAAALEKRNSEIMEEGRRRAAERQKRAAGPVKP